MYKQRLFSHSKRRGIMKTKKGTIKPLMKGSGSCGSGYSKGGANLDNYLLSLVKGVSIGNKHLTKNKTLAPKKSKTTTGGALKFIR